MFDPTVLVDEWERDAEFWEALYDEQFPVDEDTPPHDSSVYDTDEKIIERLHAHGFLRGVVLA